VGGRFQIYDYTNLVALANGLFYHKMVEAQIIQVPMHQ